MKNPTPLKAYFFGILFLSPWGYQLHQTFYSGEWLLMVTSFILVPLGWALGLCRLFGYV